MRLTLPQQDIYFEQMMFPDSPIHNIGAKISIEGDIKYELLNKAYIKLIDQHDAYRSVVFYKDGEVQIEFLAEHKTTLPLMDFSESEDPVKEVNIFMQQTFITPFDLNSSQLLHKFILLKVNEKFHYLFSVYHHLITDGWGTSLMFQRLVGNYNELLAYNEVRSLYPYSYQNFVHEDDVYANSDDFTDDKAYWKNKFDQLPDQLFKRKENNTNRDSSKREELILKRSIYNELGLIGEKLGCTTFHVILGILNLYFSRIQNGNNIVIGIPVLNRGKSVYKKTVGLFMGVSPLKIKIDFNYSFEELVLQIKQELRENYRHQRFPFGKLVKELGLFPDMGSLFNVKLSYEKHQYGLDFTHTKTNVIPLTHEAERLALSIYIRDFDETDDVKLDFDYNTNYFNKAQIERLIAHFETLITSVTLDSNQKLSAYEYITPAEKNLILNTFNQTKSDYSSIDTIVTCFQAQVQQNPNKLAVIDKSKSYTYHEVDSLSNKVAYHLLERMDNQQDSSPVAVLMDRSAVLVITLLGVMKAGKAFIPLDPDFPDDRIHYILDHSKVKSILGQGRFDQDASINFDYCEVPKIFSDHSTSLIKIDKSDPKGIAYIIYTSGSTGKPKGVKIGHQSLLNFLLSMKELPKLKEDQLLYSVTTPSFDISILEFFGPMVAGGTVYIADKYLLARPFEIIKEIEEICPAMIQATPSFYQMLFDAGWKGGDNLKVLCGGDLLSESLAEKLLSTVAEVWVMYGPTETTIWSSCKLLIKAQDAGNIGKPIANTEFYILDDGLQILPVDSIGRIYIGGDGLALGYLNDELLTSEKFIKNPFYKNRMIYDTGDLGKWNDVGEIEFAGRSDFQVKIRGYRVELEEIEAQIDRLTIVNKSVVIARNNQNNESILVAYVIFTSEVVDYNTVVEHLKMKLPQYMIPYTIVAVKEFPVTPNHKIDRKALSELEVLPRNQPTDEEHPTTPLELKLCELYADILAINERISINDNFFALGGHSLNALRLIHKIETDLHYKLTLKELFAYPTVLLLSQILSKKATIKFEQISLVTNESFYKITSAQHNLWLGSQQKAGSIAYNMFSAFTVKGILDVRILQQAFLAILHKYEILRTNFFVVNGIPVQRIKAIEDIDFTVDVYEYSSENPGMLAYVHREFDLEHDTLIRVGVFYENEKVNFLAFATHHIIMDAWSVEVLIKEVFNYYSGIVTNEESLHQQLVAQYKDYVIWQNRNMQMNLGANMDFWGNYLNGYQWEPLIPLRNKLSEPVKYSDTVTSVWDDLILVRLKQIAYNSNVSLHSLLITSFNLLLFKMFGHKDICIGTVNAGRPSSQLQSQLGMFVKTLPVRTLLNEDLTFLNILEETQTNLMNVDVYQDLPDIINNALRLEILVVMDDTSFDHKHINLGNEVWLEAYQLKPIYSILPLLLHFSFAGGGLKVTMTFDTSKYSKSVVELMNLKFNQLINVICANIDLTIGSININLQQEKAARINLNF